MIIQFEVTTVYKFDKSITKLNAKELQPFTPISTINVLIISIFSVGEKKNRLHNRS